jgi:hypothetical protein
MRIFRWAVALLLVLVVAIPAPAVADSEAVEFDFLIGAGFLCGLDPFACPDISAAANGDTLELTGSGVITTHPKSVTGGGTFVHNFVGGGSIAGTWEATKLVSFNGYGCVDFGGGTILCGGMAIIQVEFSVGGTVVGDGVLQVEGVIGDFPAAASEGVRLNAHTALGGINFNQEVSGRAVFHPVAAAVTEAVAGTFPDLVVTKATVASDSFEARNASGEAGADVNCGNGLGAACTFFYDSGDIYSVDGAAASLGDFESVLSAGDTVTATYDPDTVDQSIFALTDAVAQLTVTTPSAATTIDAATFAIKGTADPGATIRVKVDLNNDNDAADAGEATVAAGTADADGNWTLTVPLIQNSANNFVVTQQPAGGVQMGNTQPGDLPPDVAGGADDVFTITEGA